MTACLRSAFIVILALVGSPVLLAQVDNSTDPLVRVPDFSFSVSLCLCG